MKKIILAAVAASVAALPAVPAAAAPGHNDRARYEQSQYGNQAHYGRSNSRQVSKSRQAQNHRWNKGQRFDRRYAHTYRVINNPRAYHLRDAPRGYRWVQSDNDAVLIAITSGIVGAVLANMF